MDLLSHYSDYSNDSPIHPIQTLPTIQTLPQRVIGIKNIPSSLWKIVLTDLDCEYWWNPSLSIVTWIPPPNFMHLLSPHLSSLEDIHIHPDNQLADNQLSDMLVDIQQDDMLVDIQQDAQKQKRLNALKQNHLALEKHSIQLQLEKSLFKQLLRDKNANPFAIWDSVAQQLESEDQFPLLSPDEKKVLFEEYSALLVADATEAQRLQRQSLENDFVELLKDTIAGLVAEKRNLDTFSFSNFVKRTASDARYKAVKEHKHRESLFLKNWTFLAAQTSHASPPATQATYDSTQATYDSTQHAAQPKHDATQPKQSDVAKQAFFQLLATIPGTAISSTTRWFDARRRLESMVPKDARYTFFKSDKVRESIFIEYKASL